MLTLAIAVSLDIEHVGLASMLLDVVRDRFSVATYKNLDRGVEKRRWVA